MTKDPFGVDKILRAARAAACRLSLISAERKNRALRLMAKKLKEGARKILAANRKDLVKAEKKGLSGALLDRLALDSKRIKAMSEGLLVVVRLPDPAGEVIKEWRRPNGLKISKVRVPIGVIAIIYEARPNVTCDSAGLCLKAGNAVILRGGSEAINSNRAITGLLQSALRTSGLPVASLSMVKTPDRGAVDYLLKDRRLDLIIPRGGRGLIERVMMMARSPVIKHYQGICHTYVERDADLQMAEEVSYNAKVQRPGVCNAMETLLVHQGIARKFLPRMLERFTRAGVEIRGCPLTRKIVRGIKPARTEDWASEYLDLILSVKVVKNIDEALAHILRFGSQHSDAIITRSRARAEKFLNQVDSACVYLNASTRFTDGGEFGMGAEIGISTDKIHARGPMGLEELTSYKYLIRGKGQVRT